MTTPAGALHLDGRRHDERLFECPAPWDDGLALVPPA
ncbi:Uncharacterised protein [Mycobacterium tuberculosis]|nr:Uncharacterised protein [Mycobacterium tuberculosis]